MDAEHRSSEATLHEGFALVEGATLYFRDVGRGQPIIVLHGGPGFDHNYLLPDLDRLADEYRLIYYDQRGCGKSTWNAPPAPVSLQSEMDDLDRIREHFELEQVTLMGHSWGGLLAMEYTLRHPERVSRLILLNTCPASYDDFALFEQRLAERDAEDAERMQALNSDPRMAEGDLDIRAAYYRLYFQPTLRPLRLLDRLIDHLQVGWTKESVLTARLTTRHLFPETVKLPGYNLLPALARLRVPTVILHGDYDFIPLACASHIADAIPGARLVVLPDCGHFAYLEQPDTVHQSISEYFEAG